MGKVLLGYIVSIGAAKKSRVAKVVFDETIDQLMELILSKMMAMISDITENVERAMKKTL